jgi:hypothetical protein
MGRTSILLVIGFNIVFMFMGFRVSTTVSRTYEKYITYADIEQGGLAMESGANIALSNECMNLINTIPAVDVPFQSGSFRITRVVAPSAQGLPGANLIITGTYADANFTTTVRVQDGSFSQYAMYSESEKIGEDPIYWTTGDTCRGPLHTQDYLYYAGTPVFKGFVTTLKGTKKKSGSSGTPKFDGGYKSPVSVKIPNNLTELKELGSSGGAYYKGVDTYVQFLANGKVVVRAEPTGTLPSSSTGWKESKTGTFGSPPVKYCTTYASVSQLTTSGVLLVDGGVLHVKGVLKGQITLGAVNSGSKIFLDSSVVYNTNPLLPDGHSNTSCTDLLGIVADNDIHISEGAENNPSPQPKSMTIHASMFSRTGGFGAENYKDRVVGGKLKVVGGIQQLARDPVGTFGTGGIVSGFQKDYYYDERLQRMIPQGYPRIAFQVQNWADRIVLPSEFWDD